MASTLKNNPVLAQLAEDLLNQEPTYIVLGRDTLGFDLSANKTPRATFRALHKEHPQGVILTGFSNGRSLPIRGDALSSLIATDNATNLLTGIVANAIQLLEFANNPTMTKEMGTKTLDRLESSFRALAMNLLQGKGTGQVHAIRWGVTSKLAASDNVPDHTMEINPSGPIARSLANEFRCTVDELQGRYVKIFRHPFLVSAVFQIVFNADVRPHHAQLPRMQARKVLRSDCDGDVIAMFPVFTSYLVEQMTNEDYKNIPNLDPGLLVRGKDHMHEDIGTSGENIYADNAKSTHDKVTQAFTKTNEEWVDQHNTMADLTNRLTPFAYRLADVSACLAATADPKEQQAFRNAATTGSLLEEDFYLSGSGAHPECNRALELWWSSNDMGDTSTRADIKNGLATECNEHLLTKENLLAIYSANRLNKGRFYFLNPMAPRELAERDALAHAIWCIGKGRLLDIHPEAVATISNAIREGRELPNADNILVRMVRNLIHAVSHLLPALQTEAHEVF